MRTGACGVRRTVFGSGVVACVALGEVRGGEAVGRDGGIGGELDAQRAGGGDDGQGQRVARVRRQQRAAHALAHDHKVARVLKGKRRKVEAHLRAAVAACIRIAACRGGAHGHARCGRIVTRGGAFGCEAPRRAT
eukprot:2315272-Prymnesium_polylepis.1